MSNPENVQNDIADQARDWVLRLASGEMDEDEIRRLKGWIAEDEAHARAFDQRRNLWLALGDHPEIFAGKALPVPRARQRTARTRGRGATPTHGEQHGPTGQSGRKQLGRRRRYAVTASAIAASLLAIISAPEIALRMRADHITSAQVAEYHLPDGSMAWLDAGSAMSVDYDGQERRITLLRGNAYFTVRHGEQRPFRVAASNGEVEDIGTSFEVRRGDKDVNVAVGEGAVRVAANGAPVTSDNDNAGIILRAGQGAGYTASGVLARRDDVAPDTIAAWRREELMISRQSVASVIQEIGRYRRGPTWIWADLKGQKPVNGAFRIADADGALRDLAAAQGLSITWLPGGIAIVR